MDTPFNLYGISDIKSIIQGQGFGKVLVQSMIEFLIKEEKTAIGFCIHKNAPFYEKCGIGIIENAVGRFLYEKGNELIANPADDTDVIYFEGKDRFITKFEANRKRKVYFNFPHW